MNFELSPVCSFWEDSITMKKGKISIFFCYFYPLQYFHFFLFKCASLMLYLLGFDAYVYENNANSIYMWMRDEGSPCKIVYPAIQTKFTVNSMFEVTKAGQEKTYHSQELWIRDTNRTPCQSCECNLIWVSQQQAHREEAETPTTRISNGISHTQPWKHPI